MNSALQAIETSVVAALLSVAGMTSAEAVPHLDGMFMESQDTPDKWLMRPPASYPGCTMCLNRDEIKIVDHKQNYGNSRIIYAVPIYVLIVALSDGTTDAGARNAAFQITDASLLALMQFTPTGFPANTGAFGPLRPDGLHSYPIDASTHATLTRWIAQFQMGV